MPKLKDIPKIDRPREKFLKKGPDSLSRSELLAILLGSGIRGKNVKVLAEQIIRKVGKRFLDLSVVDLLQVQGIGNAKALQIIAAIELVKRFYCDLSSKDVLITSAQDVISLNNDLKDKKKEHLVCMYLNARNILLKKETISIGTLDKSLMHPREIFSPAMELCAAGIILIHNHPSGNPSPSPNDREIITRIVEVGKIMGINIIDFIITAKQGEYSFFDDLGACKQVEGYISDGIQQSLFDLFETSIPNYMPLVKKNHKTYFSSKKVQDIPAQFEIQNRRFLGNKFKLLGFIEDIVNEKCNGFQSFCDIFAGTGVVGERFNKKDINIISNDLLTSNFIPLSTFLSSKELDIGSLQQKVSHCNSLKPSDDNYFSKNYGNTFFTLENARKIGLIREEIENIAENEEEKNALITSLIYAADKVANTVGHYDAFRKELDTVQPIRLLIPRINIEFNHNNHVYRLDANTLVRKINSDVLYIDPPYNSRQYCDAYHLLENLALWQKPQLFGKAKKMDRSMMKSSYCLKAAKRAFADLIQNAKCRHILVSYNNTGESKDGRSNARIGDYEIAGILKARGNVEIFERDYKAFTTGKSETDGHSERIFYCRVIK